MLGPNARKLLAALSSLFPKIVATVQRVENVKGSGIARVTITDGAIDVHVPPYPSMPPVQGKTWLRLTTGTGSTPPFEYTGKLQKPDASAADFYADAESTARPVKNMMELVGTNCGYVGGNISGLYKLPTGFLYEVQEIRIEDDEPLYIIREANQPRCD